MYTTAAAAVQSVGFNHPYVFCHFSVLLPVLEGVEATPFSTVNQMLVMEKALWKKTNLQLGSEYSSDLQQEIHTGYF